MLSFLFSLSQKVLNYCSAREVRIIHIQYPIIVFFSTNPIEIKVNFNFNILIFNQFLVSEKNKFIVLWDCNLGKCKISNFKQLWLAQEAINTIWASLTCIKSHQSWVTNNESWALLHDCMKLAALLWGAHTLLEQAQRSGLAGFHCWSEGFNSSVGPLVG